MKQTKNLQRKLTGKQLDVSSQADPETDLKHTLVDEVECWALDIT